MCVFVSFAEVQRLVDRLYYRDHAIVMHVDARLPALREDYELWIARKAYDIEVFSEWNIKRSGR